MRDFVSCFSEHAVKVSDASCSGSNGSGKSSVIIALESSTSSSSSSSSSSVQTSTTSLYRLHLPTRKDLFVKVTWSKTPLGPVLSLSVADGHHHHNSQLLRKRKGSRSFVASKGSAIGLHWDYSLANFSTKPQPVSNFYIVVVVDSNSAFLLGDLSRDYIKRFEDVDHIAEFSLLSCKEQVLGHETYSTKARFSEDGEEHEIVIRCRLESCEESELTVSVDRKREVTMRRLQWNFRGNHTIFVEGSPVDVMWDVGDWWFGGGGGSAAFLFRRRSATESRLWLEEEELSAGFSLLVQVFRSTT